MRSLEERVGQARAGLGVAAPPLPPAPSPAGGMMARVDALEAALDVLLAAQVPQAFLLPSSGPPLVSPRLRALPVDAGGILRCKSSNP